MDMAAHERPSTTPDLPPASAPSAPPPPGPPYRGQAPLPRPPLGLLARLSSQFGSRGLTRRGPTLDDAARRELLLHGTEGTATILSVRTSTKPAPAQLDSSPLPQPSRHHGQADPSDSGTTGPRTEPEAPGRAGHLGGPGEHGGSTNRGALHNSGMSGDSGTIGGPGTPIDSRDTGGLLDPAERVDPPAKAERRSDIRTRAEKRVDARAAAERRAESRAADAAEPGQQFWVRIQLEDRHAYETRVRQRVSAADREWMQPGDIVCCRVDPGDHDRVVLYLPAPEETSRTTIAKILADGRRARATVLAATPVAADYTGRDDPVLRLDLELRAWDEPTPWRVRVVAPVPLSAMELIDLGRHLEAAFFTVDRGESVAVDWAASRES